MTGGVKEIIFSIKTFINYEYIRLTQKMSRTYRRIVPFYFRNIHHRKRLLSEKESHRAALVSGGEYENIEAFLVSKLSIDSYQIPPDPYIDDPSVSSAKEICRFFRKPEFSPEDIPKVARRFAKNHKCSYSNFRRTFYGSSTFYNVQESLRKEVIFEIGSDQ
jgi:hypothetical protein